MDSGGSFAYYNQLKGHGGWVTSIATPRGDGNTVVSASRDKTLLVWNITRDADTFGLPKKSLVGHSHFVQDVVISQDGNYCISAGWDTTLRLWDLNTGLENKSPYANAFRGHEADVMSVAFSADNRQIVSGSRDKTMRIWNTLGECKYKIQDKPHTDWVSCVRFSPNPETKLVVSGGWDKMVKVWSLENLRLRTDLTGHTGYVNSVTISPDGSLCASGGKDGTAFLWDLNKGEQLYELDAGDVIHSLVFSPNRYWLCAATASCIKIWDLELKSIVAELVPDTQTTGKKAMKPECISLAWSHDGSTLYSGYTDNTIRVWGVTSFQA